VQHITRTIWVSCFPLFKRKKRDRLSHFLLFLPACGSQAGFNAPRFSTTGYTNISFFYYDVINYTEYWGQYIFTIQFLQYYWHEPLSYFPLLENPINLIRQLDVLMQDTIVLAILLLVQQYNLLILY